MIGIPILFQVFTVLMMFLGFEGNSDPEPENVLSVLQVFPIMMILFTGMFFGWFWSLAIGLQKYIPKDVKMKVTKFKVFFFIPLIYILFLMVYMSGALFGMRSNIEAVGPWIIAIILPMHLLSMFCIFYTMYFVAKTLKTAELQRKTGFGDFAGEFFLIWFYFIGIWIIQPRVNALYSKKNSDVFPAETASEKIN